MINVFVKLLFMLCFVFLPSNSFSAETGRLRHLISIYADEKDIGLKHPEGIAYLDRTLLLVADTGNGRLVRFAYQDRNVEGGKEIRIPQLISPITVQLNSKREMFALDGKQRRIIRLTAEGTFKGYLTLEGVPSPPTVIPRSFKVDKNDTIYILDAFSSRVLVLDPEGKYQKQIEFLEDHGFFSDLAIDARGNILLLDSVKGRVFSAAKDAKSSAPLSKSLREYSNFLTHLTMDSRGTLYIVDQNGSGIILLGQDGSFLGRQLSLGWTEGLLNYPSQIAINEKEEVFIADRGNSRIQIFAVVK